MATGLRVREGGSGEPRLVLLHGLGATGDVWAGWWPLLGRRWPGSWVAPDLPGHGGSPPLPSYTFDGLAAAVADVVAPQVPTVVLGHSLGGVVGLLLAGFADSVRAVVGLGIKVTWSDEDLERARTVARRPPAWYATRDEAAARYLRVSGLAGLLPADAPAVDAGLRERDGQWGLAMDPAAFAVGAPQRTCGAPGADGRAARPIPVTSGGDASRPRRVQRHAGPGDPRAGAPVRPVRPCRGR